MSSVDYVVDRVYSFGRFLKNVNSETAGKGICEETQGRRRWSWGLNPTSKNGAHQKGASNREAGRRGQARAVLGGVFNPPHLEGILARGRCGNC